MNISGRDMGLGVTLLIAVAGYIAKTNHDAGGFEKELEQRALLISQRNRENDKLENRLVSLESAMRDCTRRK